MRSLKPSSTPLLIALTTLIAVAEDTPLLRPDPPGGRDRPHDVATHYVPLLSSEKWIEREEAQESLVRIGTPAVPALIEASRSADPETAHRARYILDQIDSVRLSYRIIQLRLDATPHVIELLDSRGSEGEEVILIGSGPNRNRATSYSVRPRRVYGGSITIEVKKGTGGKSHLIAFDDVDAPPRSLTIMERGIENAYVRIGSHLRRESSPFLTLFTYLRGRGSQIDGSDGSDQHPLFNSPASELVPALVAALREQATAANPGARTDLGARCDAIDVLGLLGDSESVPAFRAQLDAPECADNALFALARLGDQDGIHELRGLFDGSKNDLFTDTLTAGRGADLLTVEAAVILAETDSNEAMSFLISRLGTVDPNVTHRILVALSGRFDFVWNSDGLRTKLLEKAAEKDTVFQLPWRDPETQFFYQNIVSTLDPSHPAHWEWSARLLTALSEKFSGTGRIGVQELQALFDLWERISARLPLTAQEPLTAQGEGSSDALSDPAAAGQKAREEIHEALIGFLAEFRAQHSVSKLGAWLVRLFDFQPLPAATFARVRESIAARLKAKIPGEESSAMALLVELSRSFPLNEQQTKEIVELLVSAAKSPHQSHRREILQELQGITKPAVEADAKRRSRRARAPRNFKEIEPQIDQWLADDDAIKRSSALRVGEWNDSSSAPEVEMVEVNVLVRPSNLDDPKSVRSVEILDAHVVRGSRTRWLRYDDRFGNKHVVQIVAGEGTMRGNALTTYRVNRPGVRVGQSYREGVPSRNTPDKRLATSWYVSSDRQLYPFSRARADGASVQRLTMVRRFDDTAEPLPAGDDEALWRFVVSEYCSRIATLTKEYEIRYALRDVRAVGIDVFLPCLRETFRESPSILLAGELFAAGDNVALEYLYEELEKGELKAAEVLATNGDRRGVEHLLKLFKSDSSKDSSKKINYATVVASLDAFLLNFNPSSDERDQILDALVARLESRSIQDRAFRILQRESHIDFGYLNASRNDADARRAARAAAVKKAREWWAGRKGK